MRQSSALTITLLIILSSCQIDFQPKSTEEGSENTLPTPPLERDLDKNWAPHSADLRGYFQIKGVDGDPLPDQSELTVVGPESRVSGTGALIASAPVNKAISLNGTFVELNGPGAQMNFGHNEDFSIQSWVKFTGSSSWRRIISNGFADYYNGFSLQVNPDMGCGETFPGAFYIGLGSGSGAATFQELAVVQTSNGYNDNQWHHVVAVYAQSTATKTLTVYIDGQKASISKPQLNSGGCGTYITSCGTITSDVLDFSACPHASAGDAWGQTFMGSGRWGGDHFEGSLSEIAIWEVPLSSADVNLIYQRQR